MRVLIDSLRAGRASQDDVGDSRLRALYEPPRLPWLRVNMVSTVDGAATGGQGVTGAINNPVDKRVFDLLRTTADCIVVGAGTARIEGYGATDRPLVLVSRRGEVPVKLRGAPPGAVWLVTCATADGLADSRAELGEDHVIVAGTDRVDLQAMREALVGRGFRRLLSEGGPRLLTDMLAARVVDELCLTIVPMLVGGTHPRITRGVDVDGGLDLALLLEEGGTMLGRWLTRPSTAPATGTTSPA